MTQGRTKRTRPFVGLLAFSLLWGCGSAPDTLRTVATLPLPTSEVATLAIDSAGVFWLGAPGSLLRVTADSTATRAVSIPAAEPATFVGRTDSTRLFRAPTALVSVSVTSDTVVTRTLGSEIDAAAFEPLDQYLFTSTGPGEIIIYEAGTLEPIWGWAAVGATSDALAISPEGDRVYQAVRPFEYRDSPEILVRELETGRILRTLEMPEIVRSLVTGASGSIYGTMWNDEMGAASAFALGWSEGELDITWRRSFGDIGTEPPALLKMSPGGEVVGILGLNEEAGLHILDVETGETVDRLRVDALDFAFDPAGRLYLLVPGEVRRLE